MPFIIFANETEFSNYLEKGAGYRYSRGPSIFAHDPQLGREPTVEEAFKGGINCQSLVHGFYREKFGLPIPIDMMSRELFVGYPDFDLFVPVNPEESDFTLGDLFFFGKRNINDFRRLHVAVYLGEQNSDGDPLILHATKPLQEDDKGIYTWPLTAFFETDRYQELYGVRRLREDLYQSYVLPIINSGNKEI